MWRARLQESESPGTGRTCASARPAVASGADLGRQLGHDAGQDLSRLGAVSRGKAIFHGSRPCWCQLVGNSPYAAPTARRLKRRKEPPISGLAAPPGSIAAPCHAQASTAERPVPPAAASLATQVFDLICDYRDRGDLLGIARRVGTVTSRGWRPSPRDSCTTSRAPPTTVARDKVRATILADARRLAGARLARLTTPSPVPAPILEQEAAATSSKVRRDLAERRLRRHSEATARRRDGACRGLARWAVWTDKMGAHACEGPAALHPVRNVLVWALVAGLGDTALQWLWRAPSFQPWPNFLGNATVFALIGYFWGHWRWNHNEMQFPSSPDH